MLKMKIDKKIIKSLLNQFDNLDYKKGKQYYEEGSISNVILNGEMINSKCLGNREYIQTINIENNLMTCSCPNSNPFCKHLAALVLWLKENEPILVDNIKMKLEKKSKNELIDIIMQLNLYYPEIVNLKIENKFSNEALFSLIKKLWIRHEAEFDEFCIKKDVIETEIFRKKDFDILIPYLRKLIDIRDHYYSEIFEEEIIEPFLVKYDQIHHLTQKELKELKSIFPHYEYLFDCI